MFTGIIAGLGTVTEVRKAGEGLLFGIVPDFFLEKPEKGESIAVNGVCLTATTISERFFYVDISPESISRSNLRFIKKGDKVNLERALCLSDRLGGHFVSGHVDCIGKIELKEKIGEFILFTFSIPVKFDRYLVEKGSVAIDGISLTVNSCRPGEFSVSIIPHTIKETTLYLRKNGDLCNIELDMIGKYIEKLIFNEKENSKNIESSLSKNFLAEHGYL